LKKLVGYITSSFPNNSFTIDLISSMKENGLDICELGIPFSDPVADGAVIEKINHKALQNGFKIDDLFEVSSKVANIIDTLWMGYMNPFYKDIDKFIKKAIEFGVSGFIIPDLPYEEALYYKEKFDKANLALIDFIAPTTTKKRIKQIVSNSKKFIYLVAYTGITGSDKKEDLDEVIKSIKSFTKTPVFIGFGVNEKTAKEKSKNVDGVIVGSAFVKYLDDDSLNYNEKIAKISELVKIIKNEINS